ncbi:MAG TPA: SAM-dependent DNA methyltransferase, partial [Phycisphaerales bacterium]|nr:SAM-dependent DNA methyltransferase [Phycisphaerales bacterium]
NDGFDPDKISGGGRPETPERNDIPGLLQHWAKYKASGYKTPPGVEASTILEAGSEEPRCWWATVAAVKATDFNLAAGRYKPAVGSAAPDEDPAELIQSLRDDEQGLVDGLDSLLSEVEERQ